MDLIKMDTEAIAASTATDSRPAPQTRAGVARPLDPHAALIAQGRHTRFDTGLGKDPVSRQ